MRLICPDCQKNFTLPDSDSGKPTACPLCGFHFVAPQIYIPPIAPLPPMPEMPPVDRPPTVPRIDNSGPSALPEGYDRIRRTTLSREVVRLLPGVCLLLVLILTPLKWVGTWPGGYAGYSQNPWQMVTAGMTRDAVSEKVVRAEIPIRLNLHTNWWMLPYLLLLVVGVPVAWSEDVLRRTKRTLPKSLEFLERTRPTIVSTIVASTLALSLIQSLWGFGLENAIRETISSDPIDVEAMKKAITPEEIQTAEVTIASKHGALRTEVTTWFRLSQLAHIIAAIAIGLGAILRRRGDKPMPGVAVFW